MLRFSAGENFFPMNVEDYINACKFWDGVTGKSYENWEGLDIEAKIEVLGGRNKETIDKRFENCENSDEEVEQYNLEKRSKSNKDYLFFIPSAKNWSLKLILV